MSMEKSNPKILYLGTPRTVGELKEILNKYPDETAFGFRGQPIQNLKEIKYLTHSASKPMVVFEQHMRQ